MKTIKKFDINIDDFFLSDKEKEILNKLIKVSELIAVLYDRQINLEHKGGNFYPSDVTKEEIKKAAEKNPLLLHPYTFVEKNGKGRLRAIPFSAKFKTELKQIARLVGEAARISEDKEFGRYLGDVAKSFLSNEYAKSEILWVTKGPFKISFMAGPVERYFDRLFFRKCAYQAWVGINDQKRTKELERFRTIILASRRKILPGTLKIEVPKLRLGVSKTLIFAGQKAAFMTLGTNLPNDLALMEQHGSRFEIFDSSHNLVFEEENLPIFRTLFDKETQNYFSEEELYLGFLRGTPLHEIFHSLIRYRDAEKRLEELFPIFDELLADLFGIKGCGLLLLKGVIGQKELESVMVMQIIRDFYNWLSLKKSPGRIHYAIGGAITENFLLKEGAVKKKDCLLAPDFNKIFISIDHLCRILEYYLSAATHEEAKEFVEEYGSFKVFEEFSPELKDLRKQEDSKA